MFCKSPRSAIRVGLKAKAKASDSYIARLTRTKPDQPRFTIIWSGSWSARVNGAAELIRSSTALANKQLKRRQQLANTSPSQSTTPGLHPVSIHQMASPKRTSKCSLLLIYRPRKDERLSWPSWLTCSGRFTHRVVTRLLQAERRTGSVRRPKTGVLSTVLHNQLYTRNQQSAKYVTSKVANRLIISHGRNLCYREGIQRGQTCQLDKWSGSGVLEEEQRDHSPPSGDIQHIFRLLGTLDGQKIRLRLKFYVL